MKKILLILGAFVALCHGVEAGPSLQLRVEPEQKVLTKGAAKETVVRIDLTGINPPGIRRRTPLNLALVIDRSGSMQGAKIEKARQAAMELVGQLTAEDTLAIVAYSARARVVSPAAAVTDQASLKEIIQRISTDGGTALYAGVELGASEVRKHESSARINRVILLSDGLANIGPSSPADLRRLGNRLSEEGISVTTIGLGDDFNEELMSGLAEASDANYYYVKDTEKLPEIFMKELGGLATVVARSIRIEISCPRGVEPMGLMGRSETFTERKTVVKLDHLTAGQNRYLLLHCRLQGGAAARDLNVVHVSTSYTDAVSGTSQSCAGSARIDFTDNAELAKKSVNSEIAVQRVWMMNAIKKDEAIADADAGNYESAAAKLASQAENLAYQCSIAPASQQPQLQEETRNLRRQSSDLLTRRYGLSNRKELQSGSWSVRNSK